MSRPQMQTPTLAGAGVLGNQAELESDLSNSTQTASAQGHGATPCAWEHLIADAPALRSAEPYGIDKMPPPFARKNGTIRATIGNLLMAARRSDYCGYHVGQDRFRDEIMLAPHGTAQWRSFGDADYVMLREDLEKMGFEPIPKEGMRDAVLKVASEQAFDSAQLWLGGHKWDRVPRIEQFFTTYLGVVDSPYVRAVALYMWSAMAGRINDPGCQADMVPILIGDQGTGKTSLTRSLVPSEDFHCSIKFTESDDNLARKMRGKLVGEIGELRGLHTKEIEDIKDFVTRRFEEWVPKYREFSTKFPRRLLFIGTGNEDQIFNDPTGNRRWLPVRVGITDRVALERDVLELWAEAAVLHRDQGVMWREAERLAKDVHAEHSFVDPWTESVLHWLDSADFDGRSVSAREHYSTVDFLTEALRFDARQVGRSEEMRMSALLKKLGFSRRKVRLGKQTAWRYFQPTASVPT